uniref:Major facilitator superfamily (MFS) profile domain-containing protein n=1 Tax=Anopheles christyi TaxID=43041 RepID=A0A182JXE3_9DIPT
MERLKNFLQKKPSKTDLDDGLETATEYIERWTSVRIIYYTMFLMSLGFSIILTGVWPYLDKLDPHAGKEFLGWIVGANPVGQMIFSPLVGWWGNRLGSIRLPLLCSLAMFSIASGIYACLELFPTHQKYWMLYSRFLIGVSSSSVAVCRSYLSAATKVKERTSAVSMVSLAQTLGFIVGPVMQGAVTMFGEDGLPLVKNKLHLNMYTATGWINVFMGILNFCLFLPFVFKEKRIAAREAMMQQGMQSEKDTWKSMKPDYLSAWTLICAFFILVFNFVFLETLATPLTMDMFGWTKSEALYYMAWIMAVGAILASAMFLMIDPLCKRFPEQQVLIWGGFFLMVLGRAVYIPMSDTPPKLALPENESLSSMRMQDVSPYVYGSNFTNVWSNMTRLDFDYNGPYPTSDLVTADDGTDLLGCPPSQEWCKTTRGMTISQFLVGYAFTAIGYPIGVTLITTIFSKVLGPRPQGTWMGIMTGSGCLSRAMGPVFLSTIYTKFGLYWTFGSTAVMMSATMLWLWQMSWFHVVQKDKDRSSGLESDFEYRERWITIRLVYVSGFLMFLSFGVVTTGLWPYLQEIDPTVGKPFLSVVFAAPPAGQLIFSPLIGWCSNRLSSIRVSFVILTALFVFGNGLYSIVELFPIPHRKYVLLFSRFVFGISTSINTLSRAYISTATKLSERTGAISMSSLAQTFGLAIGPIIQAALSTIGKKGLMWYGLRLNMYTMAGWICAAGGVMYIIFLNPSCFVHRTIAAQEAMKTIGCNKTTDTYEPLKMFSIWTVVIGYSVLMFFSVSVQTALSPISLDQFGWSHEESLYYLGILITGGTLCSCAVFLLLPQLCKRFQEHNVFLFFALVPLFISQVIMIPIGSKSIPISETSNNQTTGGGGCPIEQEWCYSVPPINQYQLTISYTMLCISFSVGIAISQTILSKLLGTRPQGNWMALYTSIGGLTRIVGPASVVVYVRFGTYWLFGLGASVSGLVLVWMWCYKSHLRTTKKVTHVEEMQRMAEVVE